ncbi:White collar 1 protein [Termitomyces sp. T112]|nr:White collar 1 protein [Termitomyces sp. T112]KAH0578379.1 hypothetical protein H2248_003990 [Termitomyces sp. 'cryptogamus']
MPFSKYFQDDPPPAAHHNPHGLQFQLPSFFHTGAPTLAPGGGAEVLTFNPTWFANNNSSSNGYCPNLPAGLSPPHLSISAPSPLGLPVYSASGFDILSILARVASRPNPRIILGPVDMTCSFVVVDVRRHDQPIVYCSPTFCRLTGYAEHEVLGRNCRFLQAPPSSGHVRPGEPRRFTSQTSVDTMRKALIANKEVQISIVNFRKDGTAFINLVSVIPILGGERGASHELNDVVYHVGFQVDLTKQPNAILEKLRDGSYTQNTLPLGPAARLLAPANHHAQHDIPAPPPQRKQQLPAISMAPSLAQALANPAIHRHLPITTTTTAPSPLPPASTTSSTVPAASANNLLSLILLEYAPDFILVVSLKGAFLYVAPAVSYVLGHSPSTLVGRSISDLAHPEDVVPLERQLKESSSLVNVVAPSPSSNNGSDGHHHHHHQHARLIDVLFRARTAGGSYVWVEARGRLHVEPGKGRKAIILSARARRMPRVRWGDLLPPLPMSFKDDASSTPREFWAQLSGLGAAAGAFVSVGNGVEGVLGYRAGDVMGRRISALVVEEDREMVDGVLRRIEGREREARVVVFVRLRMGTCMREEGAEGEVVRVRLAFYPTQQEECEDVEEIGVLGIAPPIVLLHVARGEGIDDLSGAGEEQYLQLHHPEENVFAELDVRRGSSWQYELQQMRFRNTRLREEVRALERELKAFEGGQAGGGEDGEGREGAVAEPASDVTPGTRMMAMKTSGNPYPPHYASPDISVGGSEQEFGYGMHPHTQTVTQQTHANYTTALARYAATDEDAAYDGLQMGLGVGMDMGMGIGGGMNMGEMGMDGSASSYGLSQSQNQVDHRSSFNVPHNSNQHHHAQQLPTQTQAQNTMYAPQPVHSHSHSSSGLLHALGPLLSSSSSASHHHAHQHQYQQQQSHQQQHQIQTHRRPTMVRPCDPRVEANHQQRVNGDLGRRRGESQWGASVGAGAMHPGVKRAFGR